jgi:FKBP-type peptidyl-prolyl cis-trans isomerase
MKKAILFTACLALMASVSFAQRGNTRANATSAMEDTIQYTLGVYMMQQLLAKTGFQVINPTMFKKAIDDVAANRKLMIDPATTENRLLAYQELYNKEKGRILETKLFEVMKGVPGYATLPTGVMYNMVNPGTGPIPTLRDTVLVNIISQLPDGTIVDDVNKTRQSYMTLVSDMIPGLRDVVIKMKQGAVCRAILPASQAFGAAGNPPTIPPNSAVIYDIALVSVKTVK